MQNPAAAGAVEIGHVHGERVDAPGGENLFWFGARRQNLKVGRTGSLRRILGLGLWTTHQRARRVKTEFGPTRARNIALGLGVSTADADTDGALSASIARCRCASDASWVCGSTG